MLKHLVLWTLSEKAEQDGIDKVLRTLAASAGNMVGKIPGLIKSEVHLNRALPEGGAFHNLVFYSEFESPADLAAYQEHALHRAHREMAAAYVQNRETVDFETPLNAE
jgi:hypothetical protein